MKLNDTIKLKVCGMRDPVNILAIAKLRPEMMGFIFYPESPRFVGDDFEIPDGLDENIKRVGVFVNAPTHEMLQMKEKFRLDYLQLHGGESVEQVAALKNKGARIIKVFSIDDDFDFEQTKPYQDHVNYFLFDTKGKYRGGNAKTFNWGVLSLYNQQVPFLLSGGLTPENIAGIESLTVMNLYGVDMNSGIEVNPALKDPEKAKQVADYLHLLELRSK